MLETKIRPFYDQYFGNCIIKCLIKYPQISPQNITISALITGMMIIPVLYFDFPIIAFILLLVSGMCDILDGSLARAKNLVSNEGAVLDIFVDRCVEFAIIFGLYLSAPEDRAFFILLMLGSILLCVTSFLVVEIFNQKQKQENTKKSFNYSPGLMERFEAFVFFGAMIMFPEFFELIAGIFSALTFYTALVRINNFMNRNK